MPLPGSGAAIGEIGLAAALIGPRSVLYHLLAVAHLDRVCCVWVHSSLFHHFLELFASLGSHVLHVVFHPFGCIGQFLPIPLLFYVDLPQPWLHLWGCLRRCADGC